MAYELNDIWEFRDGRMRAAGDAPLISELLKNELVQVRSEDWAVLYRHKTTGQFWDLTYPKGEMHGGGPRRLRIVIDPDNWTPYVKGTQS